MEFSQLEALAAVARHRSFHGAAEELGLTQPAVSIAIRKLEKEVGAELFDRYRRDVRMTEAGRILHEYAQTILNLRTEAGTALDDLRQLRRGKVTIGANESTSLYLLPGVILAFRQRHPEIKLEIYGSSSENLPMEVKERNLDFGIVAFDPMDRDLEWFPILDDELVLIVPPGHRLARRRKVTIQDLGTETFVAHNVKTPSRDYVVDFFRSHGVPLNIGIELFSLETIKQFVELKQGIAFLPNLVVRQEVQEKKFVIVPLQEFHHQRTLRVIYLRGKVQSHATTAFLEVVKTLNRP